MAAISFFGDTNMAAVTSCEIQELVVVSLKITFVTWLLLIGYSGGPLFIFARKQYLK